MHQTNRWINVNDIFQRIIEIDNSAKELFMEAAAEKERIQQEIHHEIKNRESEIKLMAEEKIELLIDQNRKELERRINEINGNVQEILTAMEEKYNLNADSWVQKIFTNVIGE